MFPRCLLYSQLTILASKYLWNYDCKDVSNGRKRDGGYTNQRRKTMFRLEDARIYFEWLLTSSHFPLPNTWNISTLKPNYVRTIEDEVEQQRQKKLQDLKAKGIKGTPVTEESFKLWKERKRKVKEDAARKLVETEMKKKKVSFLIRRYKSSHIANFCYWQYC